MKVRLPRRLTTVLQACCSIPQGLFECVIRRLAVIHTRHRQRIVGSGWVAWTKADVFALARYVTSESTNWVRLPVNRYDILRTRSLATRTDLIRAIYQSVADIGIRYSEDRYHPEAHLQRIRSPIETVGVDNREGTCLDLAALFAGLCLGCDLLPIVVLLNRNPHASTESAGHALVLVSISHDLNQWRKRPERSTLETPICDAHTLRGLLNGRIHRGGSDIGESGTYLAIECTGFARTVQVGGDGPEAARRTSDSEPLPFDEAIRIGRRHIEPSNESARPLNVALDIGCAHFLHGISPFRLPPPPRAWWRLYVYLATITIACIASVSFIWNWKATRDRADTAIHDVVSSQTALRNIGRRVNAEESAETRDAMRPKLASRVENYLARRSDSNIKLDTESHAAAARAAIALYHLGDSTGLQQIMTSSNKPYHPEARTLAIWYAAASGITLSYILDRLQQPIPASERQALILALSEFDSAQLLTTKSLQCTLLDLFYADDDPGVHAAAYMILIRRAKLGEAAQQAAESATKQLRAIGPGRLKGKDSTQRHWFIHSDTGATFVYFPGDHHFLMGGADPQEREPIGATSGSSQGQHGVTIRNKLLISMTEVTYEQYANCAPILTEPIKDAASKYASRAIPISWDEATACCNWLSSKDKLPESYSITRSTSGVAQAKQKPNHIRAGGFRLPTEAEWEYACRGLSTARYAFGDSSLYLERYANYLAPERPPAPSASRFPNEFGLFDCHGGLWEWCDDSPERYPTVLDGEYPVDEGTPRPEVDRRVARGGAYDSRDWLIPASYTRNSFSHSNGAPGFRWVRTCTLFPPQ